MVRIDGDDFHFRTVIVFGFIAAEKGLDFEFYGIG